MVTPAAIPIVERRGAKKGEEDEEEERTNNRGTQWCSGITCVLAGLRAHYPEHQHEEKEGREEDRKQ